jgi:hypothetical protein
MYKATAKAARLIVLLSPDYFEALGNESLAAVMGNYNELGQITILLLISPNFMHSEYFYTTEVTKALARHEAGQARVIRIILSPTDLTGSPFAKLQALPKMPNLSRGGQSARMLIMMSLWAFAGQLMKHFQTC